MYLFVRDEIKCNIALSLIYTQLSSNANSLVHLILFTCRHVSLL